MQLTDAQREAVYARNHSILVSAAAGSGKTAVLVERIISLIREGANLSEMMICTFTRAAAAEMRQRLSRRLKAEAENDPVLMGKALDQLESAEVSTIHSFCQRLLKDEFQTAGIDPMSTMLSEQRVTLLFAESVRTAINALLDEKHEDFTFLSSAVDQKTVIEWNDVLYHFLMSIPYPFRWLDNQVEGFDTHNFRQTDLFRVLEKRVALKIYAIPGILDRMQLMMEESDSLPIRQQTIDADRVNWEASLALMEHGDTLSDILHGYNFAKKVNRPRGATEAEVEWDKQFDKLRK